MGKFFDIIVKCLSKLTKVGRKLFWDFSGQKGVLTSILVTIHGYSTNIAAPSLDHFFRNGYGIADCLGKSREVGRPQFILRNRSMT